MDSKMDSNMATDIVTHNGEDFKIKFDREHTKRLQLEEECDLLALENVRLREENSLLKHQLGIQVRLNTLTETIETINITSSSAIINNDFLEEGDDLHPNHAFKTINNACNGKNCIAVTYCCDGKYVLCAGGDNSLHLYSTGETESVVMWTYKLSAPATSLQSYGSYVACALFDGSLTMIKIEEKANTPQAADDDTAVMGKTGDIEGREPSIVVVETIKDHQKAIAGVRWALGGSMLATCSSDQFVHLYTVIEGGHLSKLKSWRFPTTPESLCFAPSSVMNDRESEDDSELIIALRDSSELVYMNCVDFTQRQISLNERAWDSHPSFVPLQLSLSPDRRHLLIATDKSMHIVLQLGTNTRVRTLAAHSMGEFSKPRVCWDVTGCYIYCNSDSDNAVYVYSMVSERVVSKLSGHTGSVRDVAIHNRCLASCSFDKSVILWSR